MQPQGIAPHRESTRAIEPGIGGDGDRRGRRNDGRGSRRDGEGHEGWRGAGGMERGRRIGEGQEGWRGAGGMEIV